MPLTWDDAYEIAVLLMRNHLGVDPSTVTLPLLGDWVTQLPGFIEGPGAATEKRLERIRTIWLALAQSGGAAGPPAM
jgi:FeS assembly protein IscX